MGADVGNGVGGVVSEVDVESDAIGLAGNQRRDQGRLDVLAVGAGEGRAAWGIQDFARIRLPAQGRLDAGEVRRHAGGRGRQRATVEIVGTAQRGGKPRRGVSHCRGRGGGEAVALEVAILDEIDTGTQSNRRVGVHYGDRLAARGGVAANVNSLKGAGDALRAGTVGDASCGTYADLVVATSRDSDGRIEVPRAAALDSLGGAASQGKTGSGCGHLERQHA